MKLSSSYVTALSVVFLTLSGCSLDTESLSFNGTTGTAGTATGGTGGTAGTAGSATGGTSGNGGTAGMSGTAGASATGGTAGASATGGTAGSSATGGTAGMGGTGGTCTEGEYSCTATETVQLCQSGGVQMDLGAALACDSTGKILNCATGTLVTGDLTCDGSGHLQACAGSPLAPTDQGTAVCDATDNNQITQCVGGAVTTDAYGCDSTDGVQTCMAGTIQPSVAAACTLAGQVVQCQSGTPTQSKLACGATGVLSCTSDGTTATLNPEANFGCETGVLYACVSGTGLVAKNAQNCDADQPINCDASDLVQNNGEACPGGQCAPATGACWQCQPNTPFCNGQQIDGCDANGVPVPGTTCADGTICDAPNNQCDLCVATHYECQGTILKQCDSTGQGYAANPIDCAQTSNPYCNASDPTSGQCDPCVAGTFRCNGAQPQKCSDDGHSWVNNGSACQSSALCAATSTSAFCNDSQCSANQIRCNGKVREQCDSDLNGYHAISTACTATQTCDEATGCTSVSSLAAGRDHSCALMTNKQVMCWGANNYAQLGRGADVPASSPTLAWVMTDATTKLGNVAELSLGDSHSCARTADNKVFCWGGNYNKQVNGSASSTVPYATQVNGVTAATIGAGGATSCAVLTSNAFVQCWGRRLNGTLGGGTNGTPITIDSMPTNVSSVSSATRVSVSTTHACAISGSGSSAKVLCWGDNTHGNLGNGTTNDALGGTTVLTASGTLTNVSSVSVGGYLSTAFLTLPYVGHGHSCAKTATGSLYCWGEGIEGQNGLGSSMTGDQTKAIPITISGDTIFGPVVNGNAFMCVTSTAASFNMYCTGNNDSGQIGQTYTSSTPIYQLTKVPGLTSNTYAYTAGGTHMCALGTGATASMIECWGNNAASQCGGPPNNPQTYPSPVTVPLP